MGILGHSGTSWAFTIFASTLYIFYDTLVSYILPLLSVLQRGVVGQVHSCHDISPKRPVSHVSID
jgi:hypothetical protein